MINRLVTALYVNDLNRSKQFYVNFLGLAVSFETDWIVQLADPDNPQIELILQPYTHELIPEPFQKRPQGTSLSFIVQDCETLYEKAKTMNLSIVQPPKNEWYGQRRFLTVDPDGVLIDVSSLCGPSPEFKEKYF